MICPQCGYDMGNKNKCIRCGYEAKNLVVVEQKDRQKDEPEKEETETKIIDPCNVYLTHPYGYEDDFGTGFGPSGDPFVSIIDSLFGGDPIGDLLGGLFGFDMSPPRSVHRDEPQPAKRKKQGPVVVVDDVEVITPEDEHRQKHAESHHDNAAHRTATDGKTSESGGGSRHRSIKDKFKKNRNNK